MEDTWNKCKSKIFSHASMNTLGEENAQSHVHSGFHSETVRLYVAIISEYCDQLYNNLSNVCLFPLFFQSCRHFPTEICEIWEILSRLHGNSCQREKRDLSLDELLEISLEYLHECFVSKLNTKNDVFSQIIAKIRPKNNPNELEDGVVDGIPVWQLIFYLMRAKAYEKISKILETISLKDQLGEVLLRHLKGDFSSEMGRKLTLLLPTITDSYKKLVCLLLVGVTPSMEEIPDLEGDDWLFWSFTLVKYNMEKESYKNGKFHSLLEQLVRQREPNGGSERSMDRVRRQALSGQFTDLLISLLNSPSTLFCHSIPIVLQLIHSRLLPQDSECTRLVGRLMRDFFSKYLQEDPRASLDCFNFICSLKDGKDLFVETVSEMIRANKSNFILVLGTKQERGLIAKYFECPRSFILTLADHIRKNRFVEEAIFAYDLAESVDECLDFFFENYLILVSKSDSSDRRALETVGLTLAERYRQEGVKHDKVQSLYIILDLTTFYNSFNNQDYNDCLNLIEAIGLFPTTRSQVSSKVERFSRLSSEIRWCLCDLLLANMITIQQIFMFLPAAAVSARSLLKTKAMALITYVGHLPYQFAPEFTGKLIEIESSLLVESAAL